MRKRRKGNLLVRAAGFIADCALDFVLELAGGIIEALFS